VVHAWKSNRWVIYILQHLPLWKYVCTWQKLCKLKYKVSMCILLITLH
jgi:hypothetical protein